MNKALLLWSFKHNLYFFKSIMVKAQTFKWPVLFSLVDSLPFSGMMSHTLFISSLFGYSFIWVSLCHSYVLQRFPTCETNKSMWVDWSAASVPFGSPAHSLLSSVFVFLFHVSTANALFFLPCDWHAQNIIDTGVCHGFPPHLVPHCVLLKAAQSVAAGACR